MNSTSRFTKKRFGVIWKAHDMVAASLFTYFAVISSNLPHLSQEFFWWLTMRNAECAVEWVCWQVIPFLMLSVGMDAVFILSAHFRRSLRALPSPSAPSDEDICLALQVCLSIFQTYHASGGPACKTYSCWW